MSSLSASKRTSSTDSNIVDLFLALDYVDFCPFVTPAWRTVHEPLEFEFG